MLQIIPGDTLARGLVASTTREIAKRVREANSRNCAAHITVQPDGTVRARYLARGNPPALERLRTNVGGGHLTPVDGPLRDSRPDLAGSLAAYASHDLPDDAHENGGATAWLEFPYPIRGPVVILWGFCGT